MTSAIDSQTLSGNWNYPTSVRFGPGRIRELPQTCREFGIERPLLVTDPGLGATSMVTDAAQSCRDAGLACTVFCDVRANPVESNVAEGVRAFRDGGHDGVIGFGGGSALDAAKAAALMSGQTRPLWDFEDREDWWNPRGPRRNRPGGRGADGVRHGVGGRARVGDHRRAGPHQEDHLPSENDAGGRDRRSRADRRASGAHHGRGGHGRPLPQSGSVLLAGLPPDGARHRARRDAARQGVAPGSLRGRHESRRARLHAGGVHHGSDRVPEGARRDALDESSVPVRSTIRTTGSPTRW